MAENGHIPVLLDEVLKALDPKKGELYIDATFGGGGYTRAILDAAPCSVLAIDRDSDAIERAKVLSASYPSLTYAHARFSELLDVLHNKGIQHVDGIVFDLGVSSFQLNEAERGFSFRFDAPLSMEMGRNAISAFTVVNEFTEEQIADILYQGEERLGRRIARAIVKERINKPIETTLQLASLIASVMPKQKDGQHPATLAFQAIRLFVNEELIELQKVLEFCKNILRPGGRLIAVTFHSLEDRIVKNFLRTESGHVARPSRHRPDTHLPTQPLFQLIQKRALAPTDIECRRNPRARSAKLRYAIRTDAPSTSEVLA